MSCQIKILESEATMSYQQKSVFASIVNTVLILSAYWIYVLNKYQQEGQALAENLKFWGATILIFIVIAVLVRVVLEIVLNVINAATATINAREMEEPGFVDERDKQIELKGERIAYIFVGIGFVLSMLSLVLGKPAFVMINIQFTAFFIADLIGSFSQLYYYRRGV
jgi:hypothetical protein